MTYISRNKQTSFLGFVYSFEGGNEIAYISRNMQTSLLGFVYLCIYWKMEDGVYFPQYENIIVRIFVLTLVTIYFLILYWCE